jgi:hypothetical protein
MSLAIASTSKPWILTDDIYDHDRASDGFSRFGAYLALRLPAVWHGDPDVLWDPVRWASFAWATAAPPVMSPGYVEWVDPIEDIQVGWDDGHLAAEVVVRTACPMTLPGWRSWERDLHGTLVEPLYGARVALSRTMLRARLKDVVLPEPPPSADDRDEVVRAAKRAVQAVALAAEGMLRSVEGILESPSRTQPRRTGR